MNFKYDKMGGVMKDFQDAINLRVQSESHDLIDIWREQHLFNSVFTHEQRYQSQVIRTRIDFFLVSSWMKDSVIESKILGRFISDHNPIMLRIEFKQAKKGKGLWKLNNSLLQDQNYCDHVIGRIDYLKQCVQKSETDIRLQWDLFKKDVKEMSIKYCTQKARKTVHNNLDLQERLDNLSKLTDLTESQVSELNLVRHSHSMFRKNVAHLAVARGHHT